MLKSQKNAFILPDNFERVDNLKQKADLIQTSKNDQFVTSGYIDQTKVQMLLFFISTAAYFSEDFFRKHIIPRNFSEQIKSMANQ